MSKLGFFSDPHVQYVSQVVEEVLSGNLQIPRFQRPYIWDWDRRLDLLRSVQLGIPMGSIMIWRTTIETLTTFNSFGTLRFKEPQRTGSRQYLLDGVQRLSTLVSALTPPGGVFDQIHPDVKYFVEEEDRSAFFDLESNDFVSIKSSQASLRHMPLHVLNESVGLLRFQRGLSGPQIDRWISNSDDLAKAFREYKIPVIPIVTDDIGLASQTFQRINSAGKQMSEKHMLHALTFSPAFDFTNALDQFRESLDGIGWSGIDDELLLRLLKVSLQLDMYKANVDTVSVSIRNRPNLFMDLKSAVGKAAEFFRERLSMPSPDFVPYSVQVIGVVEAFRIADKSSHSVPEDSLADWVWLTTYLEYFTGLSGDKVTRQINFIRSSVTSGKIDLSQSGLPSLDAIAERQRFDYRGARSRAWMTLLANILDDEKPRFGTELIRNFGRVAVVSGIPREKFVNGDLYSSPGNRFLIIPNEIEMFRRQLFAGIDVGFLKMHGIKDTISLLLSGDVDNFVLQRVAQLSKIEERRVSRLWGTLTPNEDHAQKIKARLAASICDKSSMVNSVLGSAIEEHVRNAEWQVGEIYSSSGKRAEGDIFDAQLNNFEFLLDKSEIVESPDEPGNWVVDFVARIFVTVAIDVSHFIWDSIDREEVRISNDSMSRDFETNLTIFLSCVGISEENSTDEWDISFDIGNGDYELDIGEVDIDFGD